MGGIKLQLLCGVRIELAVGALPYLARIPVRVTPCALWGYSKYLHVEEGVLQTRQPLGLEAEPRDRGLPITGSRIWGPIKQTNVCPSIQHQQRPGSWRPTPLPISTVISQNVVLYHSAPFTTVAEHVPF